MATFPPEIQNAFTVIVKDAAKIANKTMRETQRTEEYGSRSSFQKTLSKLSQETLATFRLGWNPFRPNIKAPSGLGLSLTSVDAHLLQDDAAFITQVVTQSMYESILKNRAEFLTAYLQDVLMTPQSESVFDPPDWDPRVGRFRDVRGRFSKRFGL